MIPNFPPDGQVGVISGTFGVAGLAVAQLLGRDAVAVLFFAGSSWSVQALLDRRASLDTSVLVLGRVAVACLSESKSFQERQLLLDGTCFASE